MILMVLNSGLQTQLLPTIVLCSNNITDVVVSTIAGVILNHVFDRIRNSIKHHISPNFKNSEPKTQVEKHKGCVWTDGM